MNQTSEPEHQAETGRRLPALLRVYVPVLVGVPACFAAGWFELTRALGGREIAWVYTFEWPLYGVAGLYMWRRIWHPRLRGLPSPAKPAKAPKAPTTATAVEGSDDAGLVAWQDYLARLEAADPPGGPPPR
jgi:hypothetical protein